MTPKLRRISVVIPKYGLIGGAESFVAELTQRIAARPDFEVHIFANKWVANSDCLFFHKVPVLTFPRFMQTVSFALFANKKMAKMNFHLIHTHDRIFEADIYTMHGVPHSFWIHTVRKKRMSFHDYATQWVEENLIRSVRCKKFLSVSQLTKEIFLDTYDISPERVQVVHPGVDAKRFHCLDREQCRREIRSIWRIEPSDLVILFVSMNFDIKGLDMLMATVAKMKSNNPERKIKLLIVGKGEEKKYGWTAKNLGIGNNVIFAGVQKEKLERFYLASDMFSILSKFDTFGITILEAMAASLPVVVSGNVGAKDIVTHGVNGFVIENRTDIDAISQKLSILLDKETRMRMGSAARETALEHTWEAVAEKYARIYDELLG